MIHWVRMLLLIALSCAATQATAADYPAKPIHLIVPFTAGAMFDTNARQLQPWLEKKWGQPVVVENRPGAGGNIAADYVVRSVPDGYVLLISSQAIAYQHLLNSAVTFRGARDLTAIAVLGGGSVLIGIPSSLPPKTLADFVAYAKANPGKVNYGVAGGVVPELEDLYAQLGLNMTPISYQGVSGQLTALLAGDIHLMLLSPLQAVSLVRDGRVRVLAYTGDSRHPAFLDVPTVKEIGPANFKYQFWSALFGPAGLPQSIVNQLNAEVAQWVKSPEVVERFRSIGLEEVTIPPQVMQKELLAAESLATRILNRLGIKPQ